MKKLTKEDGESPALLADNIERLREIFPEVFADGHVDFEALKQTLGEYVDDQDERYSFTWHGKSRARQIAQVPSAGTLLPCPDESVNWDTTKNIFIEGDNLEVLKLLQKSYHRKVKMIYIDPPYNTGREFIYPDKWQDNLDTYLRYTGQVDDAGFKLATNSETSGRYHTNWLNMMYPRLKLARNLMREDGVIWVSIDDHEVHNLRHLLDEVFGSENFVADIIWQSRTSISNDQPFSMNHNHTLVFARNMNLVELFGEPLDESEYVNPDQDPRGPWKLVPIDANKPGGDTKYSITNPKTGTSYDPPNGRSWAFNSLTYKKLLEDGRIKFGLHDDSAPKRKLYLLEREAKGDTKTPSTLLLDAGTTKDGTSELMQLFDGKKVFDYPKPTSFLSRLIAFSYGPTGEGISLDFFAGSGSFAHACLESNNDGARFIAVQLPELVDDETSYGSTAASLGMKSISDIAKERLRRVSSRLESKNEGFVGETGFRVFKLSSSNIKPWDAEFDSMDDDLVKAVDNIKTDRSEDDVLYELLLKYGLDLAIPSETRDIEGQKVTVIGAGALVVFLSDDITLDVVAGIAALRDELKPEVMRVVFKDSGFADDVAKTNAAQILRQAGVKDVKSL